MPVPFFHSEICSFLLAFAPVSCGRVCFNERFRFFCEFPDVIYVCAFLVSSVLCSFAYFECENESFN